MKKSSTASSLALAALVAFGALGSLSAQQPPAAPPALELLPVQGNVYMLAGAGGNITLMVGKEGVLMVDTGLAASAARVTAEIRKLNSGPIRWVINTHFHPDHVGGNEAIAALPADPLQPLRIVAHENVLNRMIRPTSIHDDSTGTVGNRLIKILMRQQDMSPPRRMQDGMAVQLRFL